MTIRGKESMNRIDNEDWYYIDEENQRVLLTDKAPESARRSFELYTRLNWRHYKDLGATPLDEANDRKNF